MKTVELTLFEQNKSRSYIIENIKSFERLTDNFGKSFTIVYLCDGSGDAVHQTIDEINSLINH
ncbi:hypothetical protein [Tenacibaculum finnmarkense]|uniref:hypothetical protein n=1 Tax=Tenacibaculum finnmarkense TaxID=2781243 RepID=UPI001EFAE1AD|nr:hypothetical protein [Tenacibaculum finnmarkense]MCG8750525.1 hypothetical protein [Tenacibaculum finnmarkense]MCG8755526.1 hypothetical protein [Tenacibaculum finnmarkense]MCG8784101.1 hypothetical protein [Tenacibaculum finnmarkense]